MASRATMADVARAAGVGIATVDRVINRRSRVKPETIERVLAGAEAVGFRASGIIREQLQPRKPHYRFGILLLQSRQPVYQKLAAAFEQCLNRETAFSGSLIVRFLEEQTPRATASALYELADETDGIAAVLADHPMINQAVDRVCQNGVPVCTIITDLTTPQRTAYIGLESRMAGRTVGWFLNKACHRPGEIGVLLGSHRYQCQELTEVSLRSYLRENAPHLQVVEGPVSLENPALAEEATLEMLHQHQDLAGFYFGGGGIEGFLQALSDAGSARTLISVCNDLTPPTRSALIEGQVDLVLSHPCEELAMKTFETLAMAIEGDTDRISARVIVPFELHTPESVYPTAPSP